MKRTEDEFVTYRQYWEFIEKYLPGYSHRDDVLRSDILLRFLTDEEVRDEDLKWIAAEFNSDKSLVKRELVRLEAKFAEESIKNFYDGI